MIRSMTGFGRAKHENEGRTFTVEIKSVNHKYTDINIRMPRFLNSIEDKIRKKINTVISRGKIDVFITITSLGDTGKTIKVDDELAKVYISEINRIAEKFNIPNDITTTTLLKFPDMIVSNSEIDEEAYLNELTECTKLALENLSKAREIEGENLKQDLLNRIDDVSKNVDEMEEKSSNLLDAYKKKLQDRLQDLGVDGIVDENRIAMEVVIFADKSSICEEITRLRSHIKSFKEILDIGGTVGKKLDFLVQEINREINTIGAKANCIDITNCVVKAKNEVENIREQIQNIE